MFFNNPDKRPTMTDLEDKMFSVVESMLKSPDCIIEINPDDMSYMLSLEKEQYYLLLDGQGVQFSNHGFIVIKSYSSKVLDYFKHTVKKETIRRRNLRKSEIFKNEGNLLVTINDKLKKRIPVEFPIQVAGVSADA
jgi:hypothetical protein